MEKNFINKSSLYSIKNLPFKLLLSYYSILTYSFNQDPLLKLLKTFSEIVIILNITYFIIYLYFNHKYVHEILYNNEEIIFIQNDKAKDLSFLFYLDSLICDNKDIINYTYDFNFIKEANEIKCEGKTEFFNIIKSKIIIDLIDNYESNEAIMKETIDIRNQNKEIMKQNLFVLDEINLKLEENNIIKMNIDELYIDIINGLIKNDKLSNYEYAYNIINQLNNENIEINQFMFDKLMCIFNTEEKYIKDYKIKDLKDLLKEKIINFHYLILKCILKDSIFIYQIPFLLNSRKNIIKIIKSNLNLKTYINKHLQERFEYILKKYLDSEYYIHKYLSFNSFTKEDQKFLIIENDSTNKSTNKTSKFEKTMNTKESLIINQEDEILHLILNGCIINLHTNEKGKEPFIIYDKIFVGQHRNKLYINNLKEIKDNYKNKNKSIIYKYFLKFLKFINEFEERLKKKCLCKYFLKIKLEIKNEINKGQNNLYNLNCLYTYYNPINQKKEEYIDNNILEEGTNSKNQGFNLMLLRINNEALKYEEYQIPDNSEIDSKLNIANQKISKSQKDNITNYLNHTPIKKQSNQNDKNNQSNDSLDMYASKEEIIKYINIIYIHKNTAEFILELSNGLYLSVGCERSIIIYDERFNKQNEVINLEDNVYNIFEKQSGDKEKIEIISSCNRAIYLILFKRNDNYKYDIKKYELPMISSFFCCQLNNNHYIVSGLDNTIDCIDIFNNNYSQQYNITDKSFRSGKIINDDKLALTSNKVIPNGENSLIIYDNNSKEICKKINGYSHIITANGLYLISRKEKKLLFCACKKYYPEQKNGILIVDIPEKNEKNIEENFFDTEQFEVYCFCSISIIKNNNTSLDNIDDLYKQNIEYNNTDFLFVGGFDPEKKEGIIKLYKILDDKVCKIEYLQDIIFEYNDGFDLPVTSIIQSTITGNILITCMNGKVFLFSEPNIDYYLEENQWL